MNGGKITFSYLLLQMAVLLVTITSTSIKPNCTKGENDTKRKCSSLLMGQYSCTEPEIDPATQQAMGCDENRMVSVECMPAPQIACVNASGYLCQYDGQEVGFYKHVPCKWTNGYKFETALLLSIFLGMFGIDRFYLGYPALGLLKFSTFGFFFLGQLIDVLLIATQTVKPSDGSDYVIDYYGAGIVKLSMNNETLIKLDDYT